MPAVIECRDLRKTYPGKNKVEAVRGLSLAIQAGECFGLLGPNGAGKTTTIEILEGLLEPTSGEVTILGCNWKSHGHEIREQIGISLQETRLSEKLTVRETIGLFASFYREPRPADEVLEALQLTEKSNAQVGNLSGGQKQRLAVATALVASPRILFLDEPTTGLDPVVSDTIDKLIMRVRDRYKVTSVVVTHDMRSARRVGQRILMLHDKKIYATGTPDEIFNSADPIVRRFIDGVSDPKEISF